MDQLALLERRRRNIRLVFSIIILATLPFYCAGFVLLTTTPQRTPSARTLTPSFTPPARTGSATSIGLPTITPFGNATLPPLQATPGQFIPPTAFLPPTVLFIPTATFFFPPISTNAPTLTTAPTFTDVPPTALPTDTTIPQPTLAPPPTNTDVPPPTAFQGEPTPFPTTPL